jgi:hypothetical protein
MGVLYNHNAGWPECCTCVVDWHTGILLLEQVCVLEWVRGLYWNVDE